MSEEKEPRKPAPEGPPEEQEIKESAERRRPPEPAKIEPPEPWPRKS